MILTQPDNEGLQHPVAYAVGVPEAHGGGAELPGDVLELLAVVHALRTFRHYLLGVGAPRPAGCWSEFELRTDNQAIALLRRTGNSTRCTAPVLIYLGLAASVKHSARYFLCRRWIWTWATT